MRIFLNPERFLLDQLMLAQDIEKWDWDHDENNKAYYLHISNINYLIWNV